MALLVGALVAYGPAARSFWGRARSAARCPPWNGSGQLHKSHRATDVGTDQGDSPERTGRRLETRNNHRSEVSGCQPAERGRAIRLERAGRLETLPRQNQ